MFSGLILLAAGTGFLLAIIFCIIFLKIRGTSIKRLREESRLLIEDAEREANDQRRQLLEKTKEEIRRRRNDLDLDIKRREVEFKKIEIHLQKRIDSINDQEHFLEQERRKLEDLSRSLESLQLDLRIKEEKVSHGVQTLIEQLERTSHMSRKEAKDVLLNILKNEVELENQLWLSKNEEDVRLKAKEQALQILTSVMQRYVADQVLLTSSSVVVLPNEEIKGKIIGKEGRNIKSLEMCTGMEFVIGDSSDTITISGFNPIRREIAKKALTSLLADGRINPTRIEEVVLKCESEVNEMIEEAGQKVVLELGFSGVHREIIHLLGMLQFRTSFSQNVLEHSKETAYFARMIAEELGLNAKLAARCGLLHDIGKAISHEVEGPHAVVGAELLKKYGEHPIVVAAVASHHEDIVATSIYGVITIIADTISASRPGARKETLATYIKRVEKLEEIAKSFVGVKKAYALQAGREIRIIVDEDNLDDNASLELARKIVKKIQEDMNFPGQIKVNVIREKRCIEYAK